MTIASSEINFQSKHDLICHAAKVKAFFSICMGMKDLKFLK